MKKLAWVFESFDSSNIINELEEQDISTFGFVEKMLIMQTLISL